MPGRVHAPIGIREGVSRRRGWSGKRSTCWRLGRKWYIPPVGPETLDDIRRVLRSGPVDFAYLFGSVARGKGGPMSDLDLAVFLVPTLSAAKRSTLRLRLYRDLSPFAPSGLDLVVLNDAPLNLRFGVLESGRLILRRNERRRILFEAGTRSRYFDRLYYLRRGAEQVLKSAARRGLSRPW